MSSFKTGFLFAALLSLTACGFQPMYGENAKKTTQTERISIDNIPDRDGQYLRNALIDRIGTDGEARYSLSVEKLNKQVTDMALRRDATYTRGQMEIDADIVLVDRQTGQTVLTRHVHSFGGYNELDNQFATKVSEQAQTESMLQDLSASIVTEIDLYFTRSNTTP